MSLSNDKKSKKLTDEESEDLQELNKDLKKLIAESEFFKRGVSKLIIGLEKTKTKSKNPNN